MTTIPRTEFMTLPLHQQIVLPLLAGKMSNRPLKFLPTVSVFRLGDRKVLEYRSLWVVTYFSGICSRYTLIQR